MITTERFKDAPWLPIEESLMVVGAGGIGSPLIINLIGMGATVVAYDHDNVEAQNLGTQWHMANQVSSSKVSSIGNTCRLLYGNNPSILPMNSKYDGMYSPVMFCAVDNMDARKEMFDVWKAKDTREIFIDGRIAAESCWVYAVQKGDEDLYENNYLLDDSEIPDDACTWKATRHIGSLCSGFMIANFTNYLSNKKFEVEVRPVNFRTEYQIPLNYVNITSSSELRQGTENNIETAIQT